MSPNEALLESSLPEGVLEEAGLSSPNPGRPKGRDEGVRALHGAQGETPAARKEPSLMSSVSLKSRFSAVRAGEGRRAETPH